MVLRDCGRSPNVLIIKRLRQPAVLYYADLDMTTGCVGGGRYDPFKIVIHTMFLEGRGGNRFLKGSIINLKSF